MPSPATKPGQITENPTGEVLATQRLREFDQPGLGRRVSSLICRPGLPGDRGHEHHVPSAPLEHPR
jgi:hypothetical protein